MAEFLEYELLTPETADPVVIRITGQRGIKFPIFTASNGVEVNSLARPEYAAGNGERLLWIRGSHKFADLDAINVPLSDWPAVKQAIRELNEAKREEERREYYQDLLRLERGEPIKKEKEMSLKSEGERILNILKSSIEPTGDTYRDVVHLIENSLAENERLLKLYQQAVKGRQDFRNAYRKEKDMKQEKDEYEFPLNEWDWNLSPVHAGNWRVANEKITVTRKKPKVKVEYCLHEGYKSTQYGQYHIVQFRVTGFAWEEGVPLYGDPSYYAVIFVGDCPSSISFSTYPKGFFNLLIGLDARDKWSTPVLLPESVYSRLDEITKALESKANEVKG